MPIYEYRCTHCHHFLEAIQKISDGLLVECPACGQATLKKQLTAGAFRLSGGGWYETDFKTGDKKRNLAGDTGAGAEGKKSAGESSAGGAASGAAPAPAPAASKAATES